MYIGKELEGYHKGEVFFPQQCTSPQTKVCRKPMDKESWDYPMAFFWLLPPVFLWCRYTVKGNIFRDMF